VVDLDVLTMLNRIGLSVEIGGRELPPETAAEALATVN